MAREKMHSTSAEEVATNGGQELDPQPTTPPKNQPNAAPPSNKNHYQHVIAATVMFSLITNAYYNIGT
ncbi:unnamed protein product [Anisakis simplex]|uniref:Aa_trans domain-containing protein n=1 Tax=Anisakis simplex TaxID=6269 RepID=A0A0M3K1Q8_ANISI|nr:unnamed protein product [Anisakis simplex]